MDEFIEIYLDVVVGVDVAVAVVCRLLLNKDHVALNRRQNIQTVLVFVFSFTYSFVTRQENHNVATSQASLLDCVVSGHSSIGDDTH